MRLLPGSAAAIRELNDRRIPVFVVTNQSGIGRGYFTVEDYGRVKARMEELLAEDGARIDGTYFCPHAPAERCRCRKPAPWMFEQALVAASADGRNALFIGDRESDLEAGRRLGGRVYLVKSPETPAADERSARLGGYHAESLLDAVNRSLGAGPPATG